MVSRMLLLTATLGLIHLLMPAATINLEPFLRRNVENPGPCVIANCSKALVGCMVDSQCRQATICNAKCLNKENAEGCNLICEVTYGHNSTKYCSLLQCMSDHKCLPLSPPDGTCLVNETAAVKNLTDVAQVHYPCMCTYVALSTYDH